MRSCKWKIGDRGGVGSAVWHSTLVVKLFNGLGGWLMRRRRQGYLPPQLRNLNVNAESNTPQSPHYLQILCLSLTSRIYIYWLFYPHIWWRATQCQQFTWVYCYMAKLTRDFSEKRKWSDLEQWMISWQCELCDGTNWDLSAFVCVTTSNLGMIIFSLS